MFPRLKAVSNSVERRVPLGVLRYALPLGGLAALTGVFYLLYFVLGVRSPLLYFALVLIISLLISRLSQTHRRREAELKKTADDLEVRVRERTEEAVRSACAVRDAEERLRFVLDSAEIGYWDYDVSQNLTSRSRKYDEIFGYREPLGHWDRETLLRHVHTEDRETVEASFRDALQTGHASLEFRIVREDYSVHWVWLEARAPREAAGEPTHLSGVIMDITERKQAADSLREQAQLLDLAHDAILSLDWNSTITFWSQGAERMYGWPREEAVGKVSRDLLETTFPEPLKDIESKLVSTGRWEGELGQRRRDGARLRVSSRWALRRGADGQPRGYMEINSDVTERRRIEEQIRHTQKLESLGVLAGGVAHDFNNLLTGILGNASLALDSTSPYDRNRALLDEVMKAAERAADLTRQLLAYAGKGRFVMRTVNLSDLVREISGLVQTSVPKAVQLRLQLTDRLPGIDADPGQMQQIVMNLVINGAEAIGPGGGAVLVTTAVQQVDAQYIDTMSSAGDLLRPGEYVSLEVHDTGSGMTEEILARIFDPFFTTKFAGRGLGLSAVLGIVRAHKGDLKVYSKPGQGTTFKALFPASVSSQGSQPGPVQRDLSGTGTVLIVDDEELVRQTARYTLERCGYKALTAGDGADAVDLYRRQPDVIRLVLLDLTMPVMSGEEALRQLQSINPKVRVLLTSGYNEGEAVQRFAGKGLAGFIQKPYTAAALAEKVKEVLAG
ncbi:putative PAS/PAC sensor hybrid histidine kinase [Candidatus Sulfopaludibacter sp. SbA6]|nr:putative PAS/PAC sensor hybrid histidine kinase [Candidatus Sulfopaludibacter sp. SbA6]